MASVVARVELHAATWQDYETLHTKMTAQGFSRSVRATDGVWYRLPTGSYVHYSVATTSDGLEKAQTAVRQTGKNAEIFVGGWDTGWAGSGLTPA